MNVCIPIDFKPEGGGHYFLQHFGAYLRTQGHGVTARVSERHDVLFTNHWLVPVHVVLRAIRHNPRVRIVQRIDGSATDYGRQGDADQRQHDVNRMADLTVFQSDYCRWSTREKFPVIRQDGPVIHNPVDVRCFTPEGVRRELAGEVRMATVAWSLNPRKGAASTYAVARAHPHVDFYLCGRFEDVPDLPNVHALGVLDRDQLAMVLRSCHALLTFSENEACPNHVLEALASGLPVLYRDSGAMHEVVGDCGLPVSVEDFGIQLCAVLNDWAERSRRSRRRALDHFDPDTVFQRYLAAMADACARPPRIPTPVRFAWAMTGRAGAWLLSQRRWDVGLLPC